jgi:4a-hydroxytetrahydrobiopterin dehydratase
VNDKKSLNGYDVEAANLAEWRIMHFTLQARFRTGDFVTGLKFVNEIGEAAEAMNHHPDLDLRYPTVHVRLSSHDVGGLTQRDLDLARQISEIAARMGATADTAAVQVLELALDTHDHAEIAPFWAAVLDMETSSEGDEVVDPSGILPTIWFQDSEANDAPHQRWHLDIRVPPEVAAARIQAALDAGGTLVSDDEAPAFWVLADKQGNQACVCTWEGRIPPPD